MSWDHNAGRWPPAPSATSVPQTGSQGNSVAGREVGVFQHFLDNSNKSYFEGL